VEGLTQAPFFPEQPIQTSSQLALARENFPLSSIMDDRFEPWAPLIPLAALFDDSRLFLDGFCIELRAFPQNKNMCLEKLVFHWLADVSVAFMNCASETLQIMQDKQSHQLSREGSKPMRDDLPTSDFVRLPDQYADTKTNTAESGPSALRESLAATLPYKSTWQSSSW
jgi:hypothetical protein